ncbi:MerR family transcriptional regulator [Bombilactobacillus thymidiniphilus]|uniref:MerR family transcriptional regulator n=1 Tax=Bombilactobacillus thymidiniphilus TaxID=2923363 RepID=A0ABY4PFU0_9LACO|nr:MerR family transcriptional regulator [Bombilactobacillus thymidiniphilus]UQS84381.1 MerR family transcriptional regulator [Bombilactobacillus thymidiniphilus]
MKEAATQLNMSEHTIRYYTDQGLVPSVQRDKNNHRIFDQSALNWLQGCHNLRLTGMSIENVKHYVDLCLQGKKTIPERYQLIEVQYQHAQQQLKDAQNRIRFLERKKQLYEAELNSDSADVLNPDTWPNIKVCPNKTK